MAAAKRFVRGANFTNEEENLIIDIVERHKNVIECKKSDAVTWKEKERVWKIVSEEYNSATKRPRNSKDLQIKYRCLKKAAKKEAGRRLQSLRGTGGGPYEPPKNAPTLDRVLNLIPLAAIGLPSQTDSDFLSDHEKPESLDSDVDDVGESYDGIQGTEFTLPVFDAQPGCSRTQPAAVIAEGPSASDDWSEYTPAMLRRPKHSALKAATPYSSLMKERETLLESAGSPSNSSRRRPVLDKKDTVFSASTAKYSALAVAKTELAKTQKEILLKEHAENQEFLAAERDLRLQILGADLKIRQIKILHDEADLEKKLLELEAMKTRTLPQ